MTCLRPVALILALAATLWAPIAVQADPAPPINSANVQIVEFGIYCKPKIDSLMPAPETTLGYVNNFSGDPTYRYHQQTVPALLGISFGITAQSSITVLNARIVIYRPGVATPDNWYTDIIAGNTHIRGFSFDFEDELVLGTWRMEAWDGQTRLYSIEFEVVAPSELPEIGPDCNFLS